MPAVRQRHAPPARAREPRSEPQRPRRRHNRLKRGDSSWALGPVKVKRNPVSVRLARGRDWAIQPFRCCMTRSRRRRPATPRIRPPPARILQRRFGFVQTAPLRAERALPGSRTCSRSIPLLLERDVRSFPGATRQEPGRGSLNPEGGPSPVAQSAHVRGPRHLDGCGDRFRRVAGGLPGDL